MLDFGEIILIGGVALVVLGPERLPQAARTVGHWMGRLQHHVGQMRTDFDREFHLAELRSMGEEARASARSVETAVRGAVSSAQDQAQALSSQVMAPLGDNGWSGGPPPPAAHFTRRYRPRPSIDDLSREIERLKRQLAVPEGSPVGRNRYAPRARLSRTRVRR